MKKNEAAFRKMAFLEHLDELRKRLFISIIAILIGFLICWFFSKDIYLFLARPVIQFLPPEDKKLAFTSLTDPFFLYMKVAFLAGIFLAAPVVIGQLWLFISPGLYKKEKKYAFPFIIFASLFFIGGGLFGYYVAFPMVCRFLLSWGEPFRPIITIKEYLAMASKILIGLGLVFELPILIFFLARLGLVTPRFLIKNLKYAVLICFILAAIITPTPDVVTQSTFAVPMIALYCLGILIAIVFGKKREAEEEEDEEESSEE